MQILIDKKQKIFLKILNYYRHYYNFLFNMGPSGINDYLNMLSKRIAYIYSLLRVNQPKASLNYTL